MMSFLALDLQVAEASVAMHEILIATTAKEAAIRQATAFPFLDDVCIERTRPHAGVLPRISLADWQVRRVESPGKMKAPGRAGASAALSQSGLQLYPG